MQTKHDIFPVQIPVTLYCLWNARDILGGWQHCLYDRYDWMIMLIWCVPLIIYKFIPPGGTASAKTQAIYTGTGLLFSFVGTIGSLNLLVYAGLAVVLAGWLPFSWLQIVWLFSSLSWMPALGWIGTRFFLNHILMVRVILSITASGWISYHLVTQRRRLRCVETDS